MIDSGKHSVLGIQVNAIDYEAAVTRVIEAAKSKQSMSASLYLNGKLQDSAKSTDALTVSDTSAATMIGDSRYPGNEGLAAPVILNRSLSSQSIWTIEDFSNELCSPRG